VFERFAEDARACVLAAREAAKEFGHQTVGTEHLLLGLMHRPDGEVTAALGMYGLTRADVEREIRRLVGIGDELDAGALASIGIDLEAVRRKVEAVFGEGSLDVTRNRGRAPFSARAKKVLELSLREALRLKHDRIREGHVLLGLLREGDGLAAKIIADAGIPVAELCVHVEREL
jgi:ATP-dependent Clp protease ATP-binding subunit ClpA